MSILLLRKSTTDVGKITYSQISHFSASRNFLINLIQRRCFQKTAPSFSQIIQLIIKLLIAISISILFYLFLILLSFHSCRSFFTQRRETQ